MIWEAFRDWWRRKTATEWRVRQHEDGLWYVEFDHSWQGWVTHDRGHETMIAAAEEGRREYGAGIP